MQCLLVESGILGFGIQNTAQGIRNPTKDWNPVAGIRNPRHGIQNPRLSWIPLQEAKCQSNQAGSEKGLFSIGLCEVCSPGFGCTTKCNPEAIYILGDLGAVSRVKIKGATKVFKNFVAPFVSTRLTASGFPRMGYIQLNQKRLLWSLVFGHIEQCNDFLE